jgi:hypothetical protein
MSRLFDPFDLENDAEAFRLLDLIDAEFRSDPQSVQCFDLRVVARVKACVERRKQAERKGIVPPLLTAPHASEVNAGLEP